MIHLVLPGLPLSFNHAYTTIMKSAGKGKGKKVIPMRVLTPAGKKYKTETSAFLVREYPQEMTIFKKDVPFGFWAQFHFTNLYNKGWPEKAKTRYKKLDASNRLKLFEDALFDAAGIDDSQVLVPAVEKVQGNVEMTIVWIWNMEEECPIQWKP